jgi:predicted dienelactone hydrolase
MTDVGLRALAGDVPAWLLYPTAAEPRTERFGPYALDVARDADHAAGARLVVISHGTGSTPWAYRGMAMTLARAGFDVALIEHPGNHRRDNRLADTDENLTGRPRHVRAVIDAAVAAGVSAEAVAIVGHSLGGYTALAAVGGRAMNLPPEVTPERRARAGDGGDGDAELAALAYPIATDPDPRITAAALLAPAIGFFMADGALAGVRARLFVRTGEHDQVCATRQVAFALRSFPGSLELAEVAGANHFAFQSPFPPELVHPGFPPSQDTPGFDRARYQDQLCEELIAWLRAHA